MRTLILNILLITLLLPTCSAVAQTKENPITSHHKKVYSVIQAMIIRSAEKMPEEEYAFKPAESVRSFGQIVGHIAESQYYFCSRALEVKSPGVKVEKTVTSKAGLIAALNEAFAYCDKAYAGMTDLNGVELTSFMGGDTPRLGVLSTNNLHTIEHYGNLVTYLRMKNIVPPTSEPEFMAKASGK